MSRIEPHFFIAPRRASTYAADATQIDSDALTTADSAVLAAQAMTGAGAGTSAVDGRAGIESAGLSPGASSTRASLGGGTITVSIAGTTATMALDRGKDGSIGRTFTVPVAQVLAQAG